MLSKKKEIEKVFNDKFDSFLFRFSFLVFLSLASTLSRFTTLRHSFGSNQSFHLFLSVFQFLVQFFLLYKFQLFSLFFCFTKSRSISLSLDLLCIFYIFSLFLLCEITAVQISLFHIISKVLKFLSFSLILKTRYSQMHSHCPYLLRAVLGVVRKSERGLLFSCFIAFL